MFVLLEKNFPILAGLDSIAQVFQKKKRISAAVRIIKKEFKLALEYLGYAKVRAHPVFHSNPPSADGIRRLQWERPAACPRSP